MNWQPIETAPRDGTEVLTFNGEMALMRYIDDDEFSAWVYADKLLDEVCPDADQPTHWMPLPAPPSSASTALVAALAADDGQFNPLAHEQMR